MLTRLSNSHHIIAYDKSSSVTFVSWQEEGGKTGWSGDRSLLEERVS